MRSLGLIFFFSTLCFLSSNSLATNGYFMHGVSPQEKALAGAAVALGKGPLSAASNPASLLQAGDAFEMGLALFSPDRAYTSPGDASKRFFGFTDFTFSIDDGGDSVKSKNRAYPIPQFGYSQRIDEVSSWGISVYGQGGMNTEYTSGTAYLGPAQMPGTFGGGDAGVDLMQLFMPLTYARLFGKKDRIGFSVIVVFQSFEGKGLSAFAPFSVDPENLSDNGHESSQGVGFKLGYQHDFNEALTFGASIRPQINMSEFDDYSGLFAEGGSFDVPGNYQLGLAWRANSSTVSIELEEIQYSKVDSIGNEMNVLFSGCAFGQTQFCLGGRNGAGFGYEDMTVKKIGYQVALKNGMTLRVGYSDTDQPIPKSQIVFGILAPAVMEEHYTFGIAIPRADQSEINISLMYAPNVSLKTINPLDAAQTIKIEMTEYELAMTYSF